MYIMKHCWQKHKVIRSNQKLSVLLPPVAAILALRYSDINCIFKDLFKIIGRRRIWKVFDKQSPRVPLWWIIRSAVN